MKSPRRMAPPQIHQLVSRRSRNRRRTSDGPKNRTVIASSIKDVLEEEVSRRSPIIVVISRHYLRDLHRRRSTVNHSPAPLLINLRSTSDNSVRRRSKKLHQFGQPAYCAIAVASGGPEACNSLLRQIHWTLDRV